MRIAHVILVLAGMVSSLRATTLQLMTMGDMIRQSTSIVRAKVVGSRTALTGKDVYTSYQLQVLEVLKAGGPQAPQVSVPGGVSGSVRQSVAGAPTLTTGGEYVIFLWTSRTGTTQILGLSQGLFSVSQDAAGNPVLLRPAAAVLVIDKAGKTVNDQPVTVSLKDLRSQIQQVLGAGK